MTTNDFKIIGLSKGAKINGEELYRRIFIQAFEETPMTEFKREGNKLIFKTEEGAEQAESFINTGYINRDYDVKFDNREDIKLYWDSLMKQLKFVVENINEGPLCDFIKADIHNISEEPSYLFNAHNFARYISDMILIKYKCKQNRK